jgi:protein-S-isoprenylcysteine O-methyltransferase Ste14
MRGKPDTGWFRASGRRGQEVGEVKPGTTDSPAGLDTRWLIRAAIPSTAAGLVTAALIFAGAGRLDWINGWVFMILWIAAKAASSLRLLRRAPQLLAERAGSHGDTKSWDRVVLPVYMMLGLITLVVASLDGGNHRWSDPMAFGFSVMGVAVYLAAAAAAQWAMETNPFHSAVSRIQSDRGQQVVLSGPYAIVRHPTYAASVLLWLSTPLILDSRWALIPAALTGGMMVLRTILEDRMLRQELAGYRDYSKRVRYRLVPFVW